MGSRRLHHANKSIEPFFPLPRHRQANSCTIMSETSSRKGMVCMLLTAFLLGLVEGLTEFLPISSTGHLILLGDLLGFHGPTEKLFDIVIQLGAILAVCWLYRDKLVTTVTGVVRREAKEWRFVVSLLLAFLPAVVLGALLHSYIKGMLFSPKVVAVAMLVGGLVIVAVERFKPAPRLNNPYGLSVSTSLKIGLFQCLSM